MSFKEVGIETKQAHEGRLGRSVSDQEYESYCDQMRTWTRPGD